MPRKTLELPCNIDHLSILDPDGNLDAGLEPDIPAEVLKKLYRFMVLGRRFDERLLSLQRQGRIGTFAPITGQEASQLGAAAALTPEDWLVPSFREMAAELWHGKSLESVLLVYAGYNEGGKVPADVHVLPVSIPVGTQIPHAVGMGYALKYRRRREVAMVFFGDGATSEGDFHEALNFAAVWKTPTIFVCQNNHWAISIPRTNQTASRTLAQKALAYGMPGIQVDGNDVLAVYAAAREMVDRAREGEGPGLIECVTYRMSVHTTADDPKKYRTEEEVENWRARDPITRFRQYLIRKGLLDEEGADRVEAEVKEELQGAVKAWDRKIKDLGDPLEMFDGMYAEPTPDLKAQKEELRQELAGNPSPE